MESVTKKKYVKPVINQHKSIAVISGSSDSCSRYKSKTTGDGYYH